MTHARVACALALAYCCMLIAAPATAGPQPKGYIQNDSGKQCWYTQTVAKEPKYFHSIPGKSYILIFDDPRCMTGSIIGLDPNKMMVNNNIVRNYSHNDAKFMTLPSQLFKGSGLQVRGLCIQSATYPGIGVAVEYLTDGVSIHGVRHTNTVAKCSN